MNEAITLTKALGIGDAMVDLCTRASELPPRGGNIWSTAVEIHGGGTTANVAVSLAKLGISSGFAGCVGDDPYGKYVIDEFNKNGVDSRWVEVKKGTYTGIVLAIIDDQGERTFVACAKGAAHVNLTKEFAQKLEFSTDTLIHSTGVCLVEEPARSGLLFALQKVHDLGNPLYFDPNLRLEGSFFPEALKDAQFKAISMVNVVLIGDEEIGLLYPGCSLQEGAQHIIDRGPELVIVKQGENGATAITRENSDHVPAFRIEAVSTVGAGDSFDAGFIAARIRQASVHDSLIYANAVACIKVSRQGSQSVPSHQEVLKFLENKGIRLSLN